MTPARSSRSCSYTSTLSPPPPDLRALDGAPVDQVPREQLISAVARLRELGFHLWTRYISAATALTSYQRHSNNLTAWTDEDLRGMFTKTHGPEWPVTPGPS